MIETKYLIIGNSAGGIGAAEAIREIDRVGRVTIVSEEPYPAYSRPLISKYLAGKASLESILYRPADFYEKNDITALLGRRVHVLGISRRRAELEDGEDIRWEKALVAVGGRPIVPKIRGLKKKGVFPFVTLDDARKIGELVDSRQRAVVIGGGLIGISATEALTQRGIKVTVIEMKDRVLNTILDETGSCLVEDALRKAGVDVLCGHTVIQVVGQPTRSNQVGGVILDNGVQVLCDLVVVAIGVMPRLELATGTSIEVSRGVLVDRHMATSVPDVYACGDVAEAYDFVYGVNRVVPIWPTAYIGGRIAGYNMVGRKTEYDGGTSMNSLSYFGVPVISAGLVAVPEGRGCEVMSKLNGVRYRKLILKDNRIVGIVFVNDIERAGIVFGLMKDAVDVSTFKDALVADDFSLVSLPAPLRAERRDMPGWNLFRPAAVMGN
ncbi:MAG: FAD-dependent oxidoreductase [Chloroflexota bacterium]